MEEIEEKIKEWETVSCPTARDLELQKKELTALIKEHDDIAKELRQEPGSRTGDRNRDLQDDANALAKRWKVENKSFSKRDIAKKLLKSDRWAAVFKTDSTIERILHNKW